MLLLKQSHRLYENSFNKVPKELLHSSNRNGQYLDIKTSKFAIVGFENDEIVYITFKGYIEVYLYVFDFFYFCLSFELG